MCRERLWIDRAVEVETISRGPDPVDAISLLTSLAAAGLLENSLPLDIGLVVGVDGSRDVEGVLQDLAGAGVDHGPLKGN